MKVEFWIHSYDKEPVGRVTVSKDCKWAALVLEQGTDAVIDIAAFSPSHMVKFADIFKAAEKVFRDTAMERVCLDAQEVTDARVQATRAEPDRSP